MCSAMNHSSQAHPNHRLSPRPMICPLIKLGRTSPPTAEQKYDMTLETNSSRPYSPADYSILQSQAKQRQHDDEQSYHDDVSSYHTGYLNQKQVYVSISAYPGETPPNPKISDYQMTQHQEHTYHPYFVMSDQTSYRNSCKQKLGVYEKNTVGNAKIKSCNLVYGDDTDYKTSRNIAGLSSLSISNDRFWSGIQNKPELCVNHSMQCQQNNDFQRYYSNKQQKRFPSPRLSNYISENYSKLGKSSPNLDQGYHTLVSPSPGSSNANIERWSDSNNMFKGKKTNSKNNSFDKLPDDLVIKIFSYLYSYDLSACARVCRRFESLAWRPSLWKTVTLCGEHIGGEKAIRAVLKQLCSQGQGHVCPNIERVYLSDGAKIADRELMFLARRCPELTHLQIHGCTLVTNPAIYELVTRCINLQHLDITGCANVTCITITPGPEPPLRLLLQYLDLTDCPAIEDNNLRIIVQNCPQLVYLYLRRCVQITDAGLKYVPSFCSGLREFSVSDCSKVTDFGLYELAKLGATLRYLSVAKCDQVSDAGLKVIARRCYKLRYLNARGCEAVSDDAITVLARSCTRLRALDIGKCDVSDAGLRALAESCPNIKKLSLRNCDLVTDRGIQCIAYYCRGLQQLNIQDCQISLEGYRAVKQYCRRCVIEHTNPGFF